MLRELTGNGTVVFNHEIVNGGGPAFFVVRGKGWSPPRSDEGVGNG